MSLLSFLSSQSLYGVGLPEHHPLVPAAIAWTSRGWIVCDSLAGSRLQFSIRRLNS